MQTPNLNQSICFYSKYSGVGDVSFQKSAATQAFIRYAEDRYGESSPPPRGIGTRRGPQPSTPGAQLNALPVCLGGRLA